MSQVRLLAAQIIDEVTNGQSLTDCLEQALPSLTDARDKSFVQAICFGVCRFYFRLDILLSMLLEKPMKAKDSDLHALLLVGLYQLIDMRVPDYAAVTETVNAADLMKKKWGRGLINAVLRSYVRERDQLDEQCDSEEEGRYLHPDWWIRSIKKAWPQVWQGILTANNAHPPLALRVNLKMISRDDYLVLLAKQDLKAEPIAETQSGIILAQPLPVEALPGFAEGQVSVQDGAAQLTVDLLDLHSGLSLLDACAAPGGKLAHALEKEPQLSRVVAIEKEAKRLMTTRDTLSRLNLTAACLQGDAKVVDTWWDGQTFDRILLDAPCSASGVVRRHPDIKLLRQPADIARFAQEQYALLAALWPLLAEDGLLVYVTCSIFPEENVQVMQRFLAECKNAREEKIEASWGIASEIGRQILPGMHQMDGFYFARIKKIAL